MTGSFGYSSSVFLIFVSSIPSTDSNYTKNFNRMNTFMDHKGKENKLEETR
jgi:hypothetical protein